MPKKDSSGKANSGTGRHRTVKAESAKEKEVIINVLPFDQKDGGKGAINTPPRKSRKSGTSADEPATRLTLVPPEKNTTQLQAQSSVPPKKRGSRSKQNFHQNDKIPAISQGARQEIYGILLVSFGLIFFFGMFAQKGLIADLSLAVRRLMGLSGYLIPGLVIAIGASFLVEGFLKREFINQAKLWGGILCIVAFVSLIHLFDPAPRELAEAGGGGGYLSYYLTGFLSGMLQGIGAFLLLLALFIVGLILAFNISLREMGRNFAVLFRRESGYVVEPGESQLEGYDPAEDYSIINPRQPRTRSYTVSHDDDRLVEDAVLDEYLFGINPPASSGRANVPPDTIPEDQTEPPVFGAHFTTPPHQAPPVTNYNDNKQAQPWKREEPAGPSPAELPHREWILPNYNLLSSFSGVEVNEKELLKKAKKIEETLASFGVEAVVREVNTGPTVTQFALEPGFGVKVSRITGLSNDLALALAAPAIRIEAPVPGQQRVGVEVPNPKIATVGMREIMETDDFQKKNGKLKMVLGRDVAGQPVVADLAKMPHLLIAGATGSGKSVCINSIVAAFLFQYRPDELKFIMVDPKMVELSTYNGIPHLAFPVVTQIEADPDKERERMRSGERVPTVMSVLKWTIREMEKRYKRLSLSGHRNIESYNKAIASVSGGEKLPFLVLIIDELADLMMVAPDEAESAICRLAQKARAVGIHLILATQRPSVDVVTGLIKANFPTRMTFAVTSQTDSRVILDTSGAEKLLGRGDMLYLPSDAAKPLRVQGVFVSDDEIDTIVEFWKKQTTFLEGGPKDFVQGQIWPSDLHEIENESDEPDHTDELFEQALEIVRESRVASISLLQRRLRVGYNRAAVLVEQLEKAGVIGHAEGSKPRPVLLEEEDFVEPTSLTAAANLHQPSEIKLPPPPSARSSIPYSNVSRGYVTPALNSQARVNESRMENEAEDADDPPL